MESPTRNRRLHGFEAAWRSSCAIVVPEAMPHVDLYDSTYGHFHEDVLALVRAATYGTDIGQSGWTTVEEYAGFVEWLGLDAARHVLDVGCGSGGPALHVARITGARVTGIDINEQGIATATRRAQDVGGAERATFRVVDVDAPLPFDEGTFDAIISTDAMCHMPLRGRVLQEWHRVLKPGGRAVFTDPVVVTGPVSNAEIAVRSSIGRFLFVPPGINEQFITDAGLRLVRTADLSAGGAEMARRWHDARATHCEALLALEGRERFDGLQDFLAVVQRVMGERRLSRIAYLIDRPL
jgi:SAM-dependent methyltransferase